MLLGIALPRDCTPYGYCESYGKKVESLSDVTQVGLGGRVQ